ncbi:hypothetical protein GLOTRDRAFT_129071 [Gloeophyllum trabeum ATCC 11539]|uniref:U3 small nucleolar RNA-associated protein 10 n=1 Tax=Gloeophyllum trabeum (strain ATCC 11539 / FP-39264 / Madison 617) TaxID=670483 RepID=S7Q979_GLOTA|nr:uncharacterized protein GLOTRDRAFT_129071 [Gloeophyllum trabeum ATCC 11539]EPQ56067.1 hypothetical protein GLOTRDRAFT_129071 [Gloeophyllum trabeum ATCC 11539]
MVSSLAAQLAQGASLNTSLLVDRSKRKWAESYLFTGREADQHDLDSIHALGVSGFIRLKTLNPALNAYEDALFSDATKGLDRTLLNVTANAELDKNIAGCLRLLGPYLMDAPTGRVIEWLVRRFRINEFNVENVLRLFLPYHDSPHFAKMVSILHLDKQSKWAFLLPFKAAAQYLPRTALVTEMTRNTDLARFVASLFPSALEESSTYRALVAFHTGALLDFIAATKSLNEGQLAFVLPALLKPLQVTTPEKTPYVKDIVLGNYVLLAALSQKCTFSAAALKVIVDAAVSSSQHVSLNQSIRAVVSICAPQEELEQFPDAALKKLLHTPDCGDVLKEILGFVGAEKFVNPLITGLLPHLKNESAYVILEAILSSPEVPSAIVQRAARLLLGRVIDPESGDENMSQYRRILSLIQQRYPLVLQKAAEETISEDEDAKEVVEQLILSLSMVQVSGGSGQVDEPNQDMIIAASNADPSVRNIAVRNIYEMLDTSEDRAPSELQAIHLALLTRIHDSNISVLETLYSQPTLLLPILTQHKDTYLSTLSAVLLSNNTPSRPVIRLHIAFLCHHFCKANPSANREAFEKVLFAFLLFSKPRQRTATAVWEIIGAPEGQEGIGGYELLGGCVDAVQWEMSKQGASESEGKSAQTMGSTNLALASKIAGNIVASNDYAQHLKYVLAKLQDPNAHARHLAYLTARALLGLVSGEHQVEAAHRLLGAMGLNSLDGMGDFMTGVDTLHSFLNDEALGMTVVQKPNSWNTTRRLQTAILALLPVIVRPAHGAVEWLSQPQPQQENDSEDSRGLRYVELMRKVYRLANSSSALPVLTSSLLRALFINLGDDSLVFLAGIWTSPSEDAKDADEQRLREAALLHAAAFLAAHDGTDKVVDFQTILPSVLVALQDEGIGVRRAAMECVSMIWRLSEVAEASSIYGIETIYGADTTKLQFLEWQDFKRYTNALVSHHDHLVNDREYIINLHADMLGRKSSPKKEASYKQRILCYLLSHVNACSVPNARLRLLKMVEGVSHRAKAEMLLPLLQGIAADPGAEASVAAMGDAFEEFCTLLVGCFDVSLTKEFNNGGSPVWPVYLGTLRRASDEGFSASANMVLSRNLQGGLFASLVSERQVELCQVLLESSERNAKASYGRALLSNIIREPQLLVQLFNGLALPALESGNRASKRAKYDSADTTNDDQNTLSSMTILAEIVHAQPIVGSAELVTCLVETLGKVAHCDSWGQTEKSYIEQLLMSALERMSAQSIPDLKASSLRLDILVELIRGADNPQTFNQVLLLMASMARLAPEAVLHNIMPIFTFMGSNVFHRDDAYSFNVVQKTIDSIVPVMVSSLKSGNSSKLDLIIASRDFLRIFVDASSHIPRHRRANFFAHLVDVLGPDDFLAPLCMLFIEKSANRIVRQNLNELLSTLSLPMAIVEHCEPLVQLEALSEFLLESQRLLHRLMNPEDTTSTFLDSMRVDDEQSSTKTLLYRRRARSLNIFVGQAAQHSPSLLRSHRTPQSALAINALVSRFLQLVSMADAESKDEGVLDVVQAAQASLSQCLGVMHATDFLDSVAAVLESDDAKIIIGALDVLSVRLPEVSDETRHTATPTIKRIIGSLERILGGSGNNSVKSRAFIAVKAIGESACAGEENALLTMVPRILEAMRNGIATVHATAALPPIIAKIGPRVLPYFRDIIQRCVSVIHGTTHDPADSAPAARTLSALLDSIPNLWGSGEITQVLETYLTAPDMSSVSSAMDGVVKTATKKLPSSVLLSTLCNVPVYADSAAMSRPAKYFYLLRRALRVGERSVVMDNLRPLLQVFLHGFEARQMAKHTVDELESSIITAFVEFVAKMNETAFRPIFRKLYDWAFGDNGSDKDRKITFCHTYEALLDYFKNLMTPYMSFLMTPFIEILQTLSGSTTEGDPTLWSSVLRILTETFRFDEGVFWRDDKLRQVAPALVGQVPVCLRMGTADGKRFLRDCLTAFVDAISEEALLKKVNLDLLMHTRSDDPALRIYALDCSEAIWRNHGNKLLGFVAETSTFIAECAEDENDTVVTECRKLKETIESIAGKIDEL